MSPANPSQSRGSATENWQKCLKNLHQGVLTMFDLVRKIRTFAPSP